MLTPQKFEELTNNRVVDLYTKLNEDLTNEIIKKVKSSNDISSYTKHQIKVLIRNNGNQIFKEALRKAQGITNVRKKEINKLFDELANEKYKGYEDIYKRQEIEFGISSEATQIINAVSNYTNKEFKNLTRAIAFKTKQSYIKAMDNLYTKVISGGFSYDSAIKSTITDLTNEGVTLEKDGRNYRLESTVKMNLFTSLKQTADKINEQLNKDLNLDYVWISITPYCRPTHRPINGVKMKKSTFEEKYEYLTEEPNCYHIVNDVDKDFEIPLDESEIQEANKNLEKKYADRQKQNYYARQVREKKKEIASLGSTSKEILQKKNKQLRNAQVKYRTFSKSVGLNVDYSQTWEVGYNGLKRR